MKAEPLNVIDNREAAALAAQSGDIVQPFASSPVHELLTVIAHLRLDAQMALDGQWDRGDEGFEAMIENVDSTLTRLNLTLPLVEGIRRMKCEHCQQQRSRLHKCFVCSKRVCCYPGDGQCANNYSFPTPKETV